MLRIVRMIAAVKFVAIRSRWYGMLLTIDHTLHLILGVLRLLLLLLLVLLGHLAMLSAPHLLIHEGKILHVVAIGSPVLHRVSVR